MATSSLASERPPKRSRVEGDGVAPTVIKITDLWLSDGNIVLIHILLPQARGLYGYPISMTVPDEIYILWLLSSIILPPIYHNLLLLLYTYLSFSRVIQHDDSGYAATGVRSNDRRITAF
ncbi:hypothetical protein OF83DRAFT_1088594 [Amylostereum chailletii]|nr:hypothetical protein OF83DRAFT_1088594 [Amylostereum chailletii]